MNHGLEPDLPWERRFVDPLEESLSVKDNFVQKLKNQERGEKYAKKVYIKTRQKK